MYTDIPRIRRLQSVMLLCLALVLDNSTSTLAQRNPPPSSPEKTEKVAKAPQSERPILSNIHFGLHAMLLNPRFIDAEMNGNFRFAEFIDLGGFVGIIPKTWGHGGSHYGEFKAALRLFSNRNFSIGPGVKRITASNMLDFTKYGISGTAFVRGAFFDWEVFPYSTRGRGGASVWYSIPLGGPWSLDGFWNVLVDRTLVGKVNIKYPVSNKLQLMMEYFHNGFIPGADQDRIGVGLEYTLK